MVSFNFFRIIFLLEQIIVQMKLCCQKKEKCTIKLNTVTLIHTWNISLGEHTQHKFAHIIEKFMMRSVFYEG
jgi:hypothetical protein